MAPPSRELVAAGPARAAAGGPGGGAGGAGGAGARLAGTGYVPEGLGLIVPPPDLRAIVDKTAAFVAKNGARAARGPALQGAWSLPPTPPPPTPRCPLSRRAHVRAPPRPPLPPRCDPRTPFPSAN